MVENRGKIELDIKVVIRIKVETKVLRVEIRTVNQVTDLVG